jgi:DNA polymerase bacteriophage-type
MANDLIKLFSVDRAAPTEHPGQWQAFLAYAAQDIAAMRDAYQHLRPLPMREWREFHAAEKINWRGIEVDEIFVDGAANLTAIGIARAGRDLKRLTNGTIASVDQTTAIAAWLYNTISAAEGRALLHKIDDVEDEVLYEDGTPVARKEKKQRVGKNGRPPLSIDEEHLDTVIAWLQDREKRGAASPGEAVALQVALLRRYGSGASPKKFAAIRRRQVGGVLANQYVFQGAAQTGRFSALGAQIQNLTRDALKNEAATVDAIANRAGYDEIAALEPAAVPVVKKLGLLVRPAFVAGPGKKFVWSDWSAIEARVLPWLSDSTGGRQLLDDFARVDADPSLPDLYRRTAAGMFGKEPAKVTLEERQAGKIAVLACIAEGSPVLTDRGLVPIEHVTQAMRLWDGVEFVMHEGVVFKGTKEVIDHDGLTATPDHIVWVEGSGPIPFRDAARQSLRLVRTGREGIPVRFLGGGRPDVHPQPRAASGTLPVQRVWGFVRRILGRVEEWQNAHLLPLLSASVRVTVDAWGSSALEQRPGSLPKPKRSHLEKLWRQRDRISLCLSSCSGRLDFSEPGGATGQAATGSHQQQWTLRTGQPALGVGTRTAHQSTLQKTYDIVNAGPRHRFTVSGRLVHNCGFGGSTGAVQAFATGYGLYFSDAQARDIVAMWREGNPWAPVFWAGLWQAFLTAWENPGTITTAGCLAFRYDEKYLGGCNFMALPSGRLLSYPRLRWSIRRNKKTGEERRELTIRRAKTRVRIWPGTITENATQACAACILRGTIRRIEYDPSLSFMPVRLHTHDEVLVEVDEARTDEAKARLHEIMCRGFKWSHGLPLASEEKSRAWYSKGEEG